MLKWDETNLCMCVSSAAPIAIRPLIRLVRFWSAYSFARSMSLAETIPSRTSISPSLFGTAVGVVIIHRIVLGKERTLSGFYSIYAEKMFFVNFYYVIYDMFICFSKNL